MSLWDNDKPVGSSQLATLRGATVTPEEKEHRRKVAKQAKHEAKETFQPRRTHGRHS